MIALTRSQEHYLRGIFALSSDGEGTRICDVAEELGVSRPSVCTAVKTLERMGLIERDESRQILLTTKGMEQANLMLDKLAIIKSFLVDVLQVNVKSAQLDACAIGHVISMETLCSLCRCLDRRCTKKCYVKRNTVSNRIQNFDSL